jgi:hypothetical protein
VTVSIKRFVVDPAGDGRRVEHVLRLRLLRGLTRLLAHRPVAPAPISAGVLGMQRTIGRRTEPAFQLIQPHARGDRDQQGPVALQGVAQIGVDRRHDLRLDRQHDDFGFGFGQPVFGVAGDAEFAAQRVARFGQRLGHADAAAATPVFSRPPIRLRAMLPPPMKASRVMQGSSSESRRYLTGAGRGAALSWKC